MLSSCNAEVITYDNVEINSGIEINLEIVIYQIIRIYTESYKTA